MTETIEIVLRALSIAKNCGQKEDVDLYARAHSRLQSAVAEIRLHDKRLNDSGTAPQGSDYERIMQTLGLVQQPVCTDTGTEAPRTLEPMSFSPDDVATAALVLGVKSAAHAANVEVTVEVVDPTEGFIGDDDIDKMPATLNLCTGRLDLIDARLGHPITCLDDVVTMYHRGVPYRAPLLIDSVPADMARDDIVAHIKQHGYRALIDVNGIHFAGTEGMA